MAVSTLFPYRKTVARRRPCPSQPGLCPSRLARARRNWGPCPSQLDAVAVAMASLCPIWPPDPLPGRGWDRWVMAAAASRLGALSPTIRWYPETLRKPCWQQRVEFIKTHFGSLFLVRRWTRFPRLFPGGGFCMGGMHFFAPEGPSQLARPKVCGWRVSFCMRHSLISAILPNRPANPDRTPGFGRRAPRGQIC